jgi:multidrug efflux pump subunit AcrA (membrane-fusion protein)
MKRIETIAILTFFTGLPAWPQKTELAPVVSKTVSRNIELPGEFQPFLSISLHAKVPGYVERVLVDRGSVVKQGELLVELSAPEPHRLPKPSLKCRPPRRTAFRPMPSCKPPRALTSA